MGMYTTAIDANGREWQFKTGDDDCDVYKIGQPAKRGWGNGVENGVHDGLDSWREGKWPNDTYHSSWAFLVFKGNICVDIQEEEMVHKTIFARQEQLDALCDKWSLPRQKYHGFSKDLSGEPPEPEPTPEQLAAQEAWRQSPEGKEWAAKWSANINKLTDGTIRNRSMLNMLKSRGSL